MNPDLSNGPVEREDGTVLQKRVDRRRALGILLGGAAVGAILLPPRHLRRYAAAEPAHP